MSKINPVKFSQLEELGDDGNLVVYKDNKLGRSTNTLSSIIDATVGDDLEDERIRLIHCRYKGCSEYKEKMKKVVTISDETHKNKHWTFDDILELLP